MQKRVQCLPLRTSQPQADQWAHSSNSASMDNTQVLSSASAWQSSDPSQNAASMGANDDIVPLNAPECLRTAAQIEENGTTRMPTPIQPTFAAQVRGQNQQWADSVGRNGLNNMGHQYSGFDKHHDMAMGGTKSDWRSFQNNRSLPSPICEVDQAASEIRDCGHHMSEEEYIAAGGHDDMRAMEHPNCMMDVETPRSAQPVPEENVEPSSPSPARKGHIRSMHTVNSWTWQPGMKRSFSIGYRSDCDKCRNKVPGHFNHIIVT